jgi:hypothetical protein
MGFRPIRKSEKVGKAGVSPASFIRIGWRAGATQARTRGFPQADGILKEH